MTVYCDMCRTHHRRFEQTVTEARYPLKRFSHAPKPEAPCEEWQLVSVVVLPDLPIDAKPGEYLRVTFYWQRPLHDPMPTTAERL